jgi:DNA-binding NarL/FixJ family response regulator
VAVAIEYAARHPERVSELILYSGGAMGWKLANPESEDYKKWNAIAEMIHNFWGGDNRAIRSMFVNFFVPEATPEEQHDYTESARKSADREVASAIMDVIRDLNVIRHLEHLKMPTQIIQVNEDALVPNMATQMMAEAIPGSEFISVDSKNHILRENEVAWQQFKQHFSSFLERHSDVSQGSAPVDVKSQASELLSDLTPRETEILQRIAEGLSNAHIGETLFISEKTVRNHVTNVFSKLGVKSRAEAIVLAKNNGF